MSPNANDHYRVTWRRLVATSLVIATLFSAALLADATAAKPLLRLDGVGPLELGMTRSEAIATGWLGKRSTGCELAGPPLPITYRLGGPDAPREIKGVAEFARGRLQSLSFTAGVRTATGVVPGRTTVTRMVEAYRDAGFRATARFDDTFQGTFVTVSKNGKQRLGGFAEKGIVTTLGLRTVPVCE